jgi:hypothetical protein
MAKKEMCRDGMLICLCLQNNMNIVARKIFDAYLLITLA